MQIVLNRWKKGDPFSAGHLNEPIDALRSLTHIGTSRGNNIRTPSGTSLDYGDIAQIVGWWLGATVATPAGQSNFTDERYWVAFQFINGTEDSRGQILDLQDLIPSKTVINGTDTYNYEYPLVASNLAEYLDSTHNIPVGQPVQLFYILDIQDPPVAHWFFTMGGTSTPGLIPCEVTEDGTGVDGTQTTQAGWKYTVKDITGTTTLATHAVPVFRTNGNGSSTKATLGTYYKTSGGAIILWAVNENPATGPC